MPCVGPDLPSEDALTNLPLPVAELIPLHSLWLFTSPAMSEAMRGVFSHTDKVGEAAIK